MVSQGETFRVIATITDIDGNPVLPAAGGVHEIDVNNPSGTTVYTSAAPVHDGSGVYHRDFTIAAAQPVGGWRVIWKITVGTSVGIGKIPFFVDDP